MKTTTLIAGFLFTLSLHASATHTFVSSSKGHNKENTRLKTMKKAEQRAILECKEHDAKHYRIKPARCSIDKGKQHKFWSCLSIVTCFKE